MLGSDRPAMNQFPVQEGLAPVLSFQAREIVPRVFHPFRANLTKKATLKSLESSVKGSNFDWFKNNGN